MNPLPPSREVCPVCRGARDVGYPRCYSCTQAYGRSDGILADAVVPISYSPDDGQHYYQLKVYKSPTAPNRLAYFRLAVLYTLFEPDRFHIPVFGSELPPPRVLLLEDLWVTGARAHSMAHALKLAGATAVITVALGRQMNHAFLPNRAILDKARHRPFDLNRCPLDDFSP